MRVPHLRLQCAEESARLPIVTVDEPIYKRVPAFMIATADKFAGLTLDGGNGEILPGRRPGQTLGHPTSSSRTSST